MKASGICFPSNLGSLANSAVYCCCWFCCECIAAFASANAVCHAAKASFSFRPARCLHSTSNLFLSASASSLAFCSASSLTALFSSLSSSSFLLSASSHFLFSSLSSSCSAPFPVSLLLLLFLLFHPPLILHDQMLQEIRKRSLTVSHTSVVLIRLS